MCIGDSLTRNRWIWAKRSPFAFTQCRSLLFLPLYACLAWWYVTWQTFLSFQSLLLRAESSVTTKSFCGTWHGSEHRFRDSVRRADFTFCLMQAKAPTVRKPQPPLNVMNESLGTSQKTMLCYCLAVPHTNLVCTTNLTPLWAQVWIKVFGTGIRTGFIVILRAPQNEGTQFLRGKIHCNFTSVSTPPSLSNQFPQRRP